MATTVRPDASGHQYVDFDEYIDYQLQKTRSNIKMTDVLTAGVGVAALVLGYLLLFVMLDHWVIPGGFGMAARIVMLGSVLIGAVAWMVWRVILPYTRKVNGLYAARVIEKSAPTLKSNLLNLIDLQRAGRPVPEEIRTALEKRAALSLSEMDVDQAVDRRTLMRLSYVLLAIVVLCCAYTVFSPKRISSSIWRALFPTADVAVATTTEIVDVKPGDAEVLSRGQLPVTAVLRTRGEVPDEITLRYTTRDRRFVDEPIAMRRVDDTVKQYRGVISGESGRGILQDLTYHIEAGDARTAAFQVTVIQPPSARVEQLEYRYPKYMEFPPRTVPGGDIDCWEGTKVTVTAKSNLPVTAAVLRFSDDETFSVKAEERRMQIEDGTELSVTLDDEIGFREDGSFPRFYRIECRDEQGRTDPQPTVYSVRILRDKPPVVVLHDPVRDLTLPANAILPLLISAEDPDFQLRALTLRLEKNGEPVFRSEPIFDGLQQQWTGTFDWKLEPYGFQTDDVVTFWIEARDNKAPEGNRAFTQKLKITIQPDAPPEQIEEQLEADRERQQQKLEEARQQQNDAQRDQQQQPGDEQGEQEQQPAGGDEAPQEGQPQQQPGEQQQEGEGDQGEGSGQPQQSEKGGEGGEPQPGNNGSKQGDSSSPDGTGSESRNLDPENPEDQGEILREFLKRQQEKQNRENSPQDKSQQQPGGANADQQPNEGEPQEGQPEPQENGNPSQQPSGDGSDRNPNQKPEDGSDESGEKITVKPDDKPQDGNDPGKPESEPGDKSDPMNSTEPGGQKPEQNGPNDKPGDGDNQAGEKPDGTDKGDQPGDKPKPEPGDKPDGAPGDGDSAPTGGGDDPNAPKTDKPSKSDQDQKPQDGAAGDESKGADGGEGGSDQGNPGGSPTKDDDKNSSGKPAPGAKDPKDPSKQGGEPTDEPLRGEERPADSEEGARKQKANGDETGEATPDHDPNADPTRAKNELKRKGDEPPATRPNQDGADPDAPKSSDPGSGNPMKSETPPRTQPGDQPNPDQRPSEGQDDRSQKPRANREGKPNPGNEEMKGPGRPEGQNSESSDSGEGGSGKQNDQGNPGSKQPGAGDTANKPGAADKSDKPNGGAAGQEKGPGSQNREGNQGGQKPSSDSGQDGAAGDNASQKQDPGKPGNEASKPAGGEPSSEKSGDPAGGKPGQSGQQSPSGQPGQSQAEGAGGRGSQKDSPRGGGNARGGAPGRADGDGAGTGDSSPPLSDEGNLEYGREAANLVLKQLEDQLERGEIDEDLAKRLGWNDKDMHRYADILKKQLERRGVAEDSPISAAEQRQFDEVLKNLRFQAAQGNRSGRGTGRRGPQTLDARRLPVPAEYRDAYDAFTRSFTREK